MNKNDIFRPFTGTIDELLNHVKDNIDPEDVENIVIDKHDDVLLTDDEVINLIVAETGVDEEEAKDILMDMKRQEVESVINKMVDEGLVEVVRYDDNGDPVYGLTDNGKFISDQLNES